METGAVVREGMETPGRENSIKQDSMKGSRLVCLEG
jgi:hypothetical protein